MLFLYACLDTRNVGKLFHTKHDSIMSVFAATISGTAGDEVITKRIYHWLVLTGALGTSDNVLLWKTKTASDFGVCRSQAPAAVSTREITMPKASGMSSEIR